MHNLTRLENRLKYSFILKDNLKKAVTHASYMSGPDNNNERLEFLGDAILNFIVSEYLYKHYPGYDEGNLSRIKAYVASEEFLYGIAKSFKIGKYILLGKGEDKTGGREKKSILSDTLEAIIAAIFIDGGISRTRKVVLFLFSKEIRKLLKDQKDLKDYKSKLQEYCLSVGKSVPRYKVDNEYGPEHKKTFEISVWINNENISSGSGMSKKEAEQLAAQNAITDLKI